MSVEHWKSILEGKEPTKEQIKKLKALAKSEIAEWKKFLEDLELLTK